METKQSNKAYYDKISIANLQKAVEVNAGSKNSEETKNKRKETLRIYYETHDSPHKGVPLTEDHKNKISQSWSEERKKAKSGWMKNRIKENPDIVKTKVGNPVIKLNKKSLYPCRNHGRIEVSYSVRIVA